MPKKSNRVIILGSAVVLILIIAPIGSYFFLKHGIEYRIESLDQLSPKTIDSELSGYLDNFIPENGNARLIHIPGKERSGELDLLYKIDERITDRERFDIYSFAKDADHEDLRDIKFIMNGSPPNSDLQFILIDTSNVIRSTYAYDENTGKEIIRHLSVVIPMPKQKKIVLDR